MGFKEFGITLIENKQDFRSIGFYKAVLTEFISTLLFLFFTLGNVFNNCTADYDLAGSEGNGDGKCQTTSARVLSISFSFGVAIFVLVYAAASFRCSVCSSPSLSEQYSQVTQGFSKVSLAWRVYVAHKLRTFHGRVGRRFCRRLILLASATR